MDLPQLTDQVNLSSIFSGFLVSHSLKEPPSHSCLLFRVSLQVFSREFWGLLIGYLAGEGGLLTTSWAGVELLK